METARDTFHSVIEENVSTPTVITIDIDADSSRDEVSYMVMELHGEFILEQNIDYDGTVNAGSNVTLLFQLFVGLSVPLNHPRDERRQIFFLNELLSLN